MLLSSTVAVKRVVTCFILSSSSSKKGRLSDAILTRDNLRVAVFRRCPTMPTFPSHWAGISGSMEDGEAPRQTAQRELQEETNLIVRPEIIQGETQDDDDDNESCSNSVACEFMNKESGLYLDVPFQKNRVIRVYPFAVRLLEATRPNKQQLELRGTEHDEFRFVSIPELERLEPTVPGLADAFHRATYGRYLAREVLPASIWKWSEDRVNGAATLAKQIVELMVQEQQQNSTTTSAIDLGTIAMLRPTMVPIVNVLRALEEKQNQAKNATKDNDVMLQEAAQEIIDSLDDEVDTAIELGAAKLLELYENASLANTQQHPNQFTIATFSRSSTIVKVIIRFLQDLAHDDATSNSLSRQQQQPFICIECAISTPGDEGLFMQRDLSHAISDIKSANRILVESTDDDELHNSVRQGSVNVVLVGSDCIMDQYVVNKIGTRSLAETCRKASTASGRTIVLCCADRWKIWEDVFPPPLEDIFECVPRNLFDHVLVPNVAPSAERGGEC